MRLLRMVRISIICILLFAAAPGPVQAAQVTGAPWMVNTTADTTDANLDDYTCADSTGHCSLRAAVQQANYMGTSVMVDINIQLQRSTTYNISSLLQITADKITIQTASGAGSQAIISGISGRSIAVSGIGNLTLFDVQVSSAGGILVDGASSYLTLHTATLQNLSFTATSPQAADGGGAIFISGGSVDITNSTFSGNITNGNGGAIYNNRGSLHIDASTFTNNSAANGGAIFNISDSDARLHLWSVVMEDNTASGFGGALYLNGYNFQTSHGASSVFVEKSRIRNNTAADGGGIYVGGRYNSDTQLYTHGGMNVMQSEISGNTTTTGNGGGIYVNSTTDTGNDYIYVENSTITGNQAFLAGGGLYIAADPTNAVHLFNTTVTQNAADRTGGEAKNGGGYFNAAGSTLNLKNSILAGNSDLTSGSFPIWIPDCVGTINLYHSLLGYKQVFCTVEADWTGFYGTSSPLDAGLGPRTESPVFLTWYHPLESDSPAINQGDPAGCKGIGNRLLSEDQNANNRIRGMACDMGAVESSHSGYAVFLPAVLR